MIARPHWPDLIDYLSRRARLPDLLPSQLCEPHLHRQVPGVHRIMRWQRMIGDRGVRSPGVKIFPLALEHPLRIRFANFSLLQGGVPKSKFRMAPK